MTLAVLGHKSFKLTIPDMSGQSLKQPAIICKVLSFLISVVVGLWLLPPRWGVNTISDVQAIVLAILSLIPNRWLVSSRISFVVFLLIALFPFGVYFSVSAYKGASVVLILVGLFFAICIFAPLPMSLVLSRIRLQKGETFTYA